MLKGSGLFFSGTGMGVIMERQGAGCRAWMLLIY